MSMGEKSAVITGGYGFLGSNLAKRLIEKEGMNVTLIVCSDEKRKNIRNLEDKVNIITMRINQKSSFEKLLDVDYFFHFAWQTDLEESMKNPLEDLRTDLGGLMHLLEEYKKVGGKAKIIFPSTVTIQGTEETKGPLSIYDANKLAAENYLKVYGHNYGLKFTCLRLSNVFGERQKIDNPRRGILNFMIGEALRGNAIQVYGDGTALRDYSYVDNFIDAFVLAAESENTNGRTYVLGSGRGRTFNEVTKTIQAEIKEFSGKDTEVIYRPYPSRINEINKRNFVANPGEFMRDTNWKPSISFEEGIRRTINFYNEKE